MCKSICKEITNVFLVKLPNAFLAKLTSYLPHSIKEYIKIFIFLIYPKLLNASKASPWFALHLINIYDQNDENGQNYQNDTSHPDDNDDDEIISLVVH